MGDDDFFEPYLINFYQTILTSLEKDQYLVAVEKIETSLKFFSHDELAEFYALALYELALTISPDLGSAEVVEKSKKNGLELQNKQNICDIVSTYFDDHKIRGLIYQVKNMEMKEFLLND